MLNFFFLHSTEEQYSINAKRGFSYHKISNAPIEAEKVCYNPTTETDVCPLEYKETHSTDEYCNYDHLFLGGDMTVKGELLKDVLYIDDIYGVDHRKLEIVGDKNMKQITTERKVELVNANVETIEAFNSLALTNCKLTKSINIHKIETRILDLEHKYIIFDENTVISPDVKVSIFFSGHFNPYITDKTGSASTPIKEITLDLADAKKDDIKYSDFVIMNATKADYFKNTNITIINNNIKELNIRVVIKNNEAILTSKEDEDDSFGEAVSLELILGIAGGAIVVIAIISCIACCCKKRSNKESETLNNQLL